MSKSNLEDAMTRFLSTMLLSAIALTCSLSLVFPALAATHYCSPTGSASWANSTSISTPCSITTAFSNAAAGDVVYLRGGTYSVGSSLNTGQAGTGDAEANRVVFRAYTGEAPDVVCSSGVSPCVQQEHNYWWFDGISFHGSNFSAGEGIIKVGENGTANYLKVTNCTLHITSAASQDNVDCIILQANRSNYAYIYSNTFIGPGTNSLGAVCQLGGGNVGTKILNNVVHDFNVGFYTKHMNGDTSLASGAEWAYNHLYNITGDGCFIGIPGYINIHDNVCVATGQATYFGLNGGGSNGTNSVISHNTIVGKFYAANENGGMINYTIRNNIISSYEMYGGSGNSWSYNMYRSGSAIGTHDLANTSPTYVGGSSPTTITGFALATGSNGKAAGSDGADMGANTALVGPSSRPGAPKLNTVVPN